MANYQHIQMLEMQNRILRARQQNLLYKTQLGHAIIANSSTRAPENPVRIPPLYTPAVVSMINREHSLVANQAATQRQNIAESKTTRADVLSCASTRRNDQPILRESPSQYPYKHSNAAAFEDQRRPTEGDRSLQSSMGPIIMSPIENVAVAPPAIDNLLIVQNVGTLKVDNKSNDLSGGTHNHHNEELNTLVQELEMNVEDNTKVLQTDKFLSLPKDQQAQRVKREESKQNRQNIESLLKMQDSNQMRLPLWKHKLSGNSNPSKSLIIGGRRLFRCVAFAMIVMVIRPSLSIARRETLRMETFRKDFRRTLTMIIESISDWLGKIVQLPVASIVRDDSLDFSPKDGFVTGSTVPFKARMTQLKVRLKTMVQSIADSPLPPHHITSLLMSLLEDKVYFPNGFLWEFEMRSLEFSRLGATRNMVPSIDILSFDKEKGMFEVVQNDGGKICYDGRKVRMLLVNILLVRILVGKLLSAPWNYHVSQVPVARSMKKVATNLRVFASVLYRLFQDLNSDLPAVIDSHALEGPTSETQSSATFFQRKNMLNNMLKLIDLERSKMFDHNDKHPTDFQLAISAPTNSFDSIDTFMSHLLSNKSLGPIDATLAELKTELIPPLSNWINKVTQHLISALHHRNTRGVTS